MINAGEMSSDLNSMHHKTSLSSQQSSLIRLPANLNSFVLVVIGAAVRAAAAVGGLPVLLQLGRLLSFVEDSGLRLVQDVALDLKRGLPVFVLGQGRVDGLGVGLRVSDVFHLGDDVVQFVALKRETNDKDNSKIKAGIKTALGGNSN